MNAIPMLILVIVVLIFMGTTLRRPLQQIRRLRRATYGPIGTMPTTGMVGVRGQADGEALGSPLTDTTCVLWHIVVERYHNKHWRTVYERSSAEPVTLDDGSGQIQVLPIGAQLLLADDLRQTRGLMSRINPQIELKLEELGVETQGLLGRFGHNLRVFERYILAGEQLSALGQVEPGEDQPVLQAVPDTPLLLADQTLDDVRKGLYRRVASMVAIMVLIVSAFSCCLLLPVLESR